MAKTNATKRPITHKILTSNIEYDSTKNLLTYIQSEIADCSVNGLPSIIKIQLIKNTNMNLTKENGLLNLSIPIIPVCYNFDSSRSLSEFISDAKEPHISAEKTKHMDSETFEKRINSYANKVMIYVKNELALRYTIAKNNNDQKTMKQIKGLAVMENIDLDLYALLIKEPVNIVETRVDKNNSLYILEYTDGSKETITKEQYRLVSSYFRFMNDYNRSQKKIFALSKALHDYENYDITHEKNTSTVPQHSIIARGISSNNNRVKKPETKKPTEKKNNDNTSKKQKGEE